MVHQIDWWGCRARERVRCLEAIDKHIKHAEADIRDHKRDPEAVRIELKAYLRGLKDARFAIQELD